MWRKAVFYGDNPIKVRRRSKPIARDCILQAQLAGLKLSNTSGYSGMQNQNIWLRTSFCARQLLRLPWTPFETTKGQGHQGEERILAQWWHSVEGQLSVISSPADASLSLCRRAKGKPAHTSTHMNPCWDHGDSGRGLPLCSGAFP